MRANLIDLHSHTTYSDGTRTPQALIELAYELGIRCLAITDHDTLLGYLSVDQSQLPTDFRLIAGVEISCHHTLFGGFGRHESIIKSIHIVALDVQDTSSLQTWLYDVQKSRAHRGLAIVQKLGQIIPQLAIDEFWQAVVSKAASKEAVGRAHIAQTLYEFGLVNSVQSAFDKYLADNKPAYVALHAPTMNEAILMIHRCGGLAVLAHPTCYNLSATRIRRLITDFANASGNGCELPNNEAVSQRQMIDRQIALHGLQVSVGSDFHGATMPWRKLGQVAQLAPHQTGIWTNFSHPI